MRYDIFSCLIVIINTQVLLNHLSSVVRVRTDQLVVESEQERRRLMNEGMGEDMARMEVYRFVFNYLLLIN